MREGKIESFVAVRKKLIYIECNGEIVPKMKFTLFQVLLIEKITKFSLM